MCRDCRQIAEEYQDLLEARTQALVTAQDRVGEMKRELDREKRRANMYEQVAKAGIPAVIIAWMDQDINQLLAVGEPSNPSDVGN